MHPTNRSHPIGLAFPWLHTRVAQHGCCATWCIHTREMTCVTGLSDMSHLHAWHVLVTWVIYICMTWLLSVTCWCAQTKESTSMNSWRVTAVQYVWKERPRKESYVNETWSMWKETKESSDMTPFSNLLMCAVDSLVSFHIDQVSFT